jgi:hypothetical protein
MTRARDLAVFANNIDATGALTSLATSGNFTATGSIQTSGNITATNSGFRSFIRNHSSVNASAGAGSPTSTKVVQLGDGIYEYGFYFSAGTGGFPTCPNSFWVVCPVQRQNNGTLAWAEVTIRGVHRGMWGASGYDEYASIIVGGASDGGGIWVKEWKNGESNNSSNRMRVGWMNFDNTYNEGSNYNTGFNVNGGITGNTIGNSYNQMPLFIKIFTNCGADKEYYFTVRTNNIEGLGPPRKGPMWLAPNVNPTSTIYRI